MNDSNSENQVPAVIAALRRFNRPRPLEQCDLCSLGLAAEHQHLFEPKSRQLLCSCDPCAILFSGQAEMKYKRVPRRTRFLADFELTDLQWDNLLIPIGMAFFFYSTPAEKTIALYPSPAGPVESLLELEAWQELEETNPILQKMEADVEALLVNRIGTERQYFIAPIDECFKLVGLIRTKWQGLSGGSEVWNDITEFFTDLKKRSTVIGESSVKAKAENSR
ncbi:MAG TPA: DUF5947 family protein [Pyrinomonadaceae bacterium]|jgi:hypothetical protein|nr:DUF5947 family protein [Pyrinomonadaceae bacterium]